mgnify:FL=1
MDIISDINESKDRLERQRQDVHAEEEKMQTEVNSKPLNTAPGPHFDFGDDHQDGDAPQSGNSASDDYDDSHGEILQFAS